MMRTSYADVYAGPYRDKLRCDTCHEATPAWALYEIVEGKPDQGWQCGSCFTDTDRAVEQARALAAKLPDTDWRSDYGLYLKNERNRLLDASRWTIMPDSPLSDACQTAYKTYLNTLQQMTLNNATTKTWKFPGAPPLVYPALIFSPDGTMLKTTAAGAVINVKVTK